MNSQTVRALTLRAAGVVLLALTLHGCSANGDGTTSVSLDLDPPAASPPELPAVSLTVQPETIQSSESATLSWTSSSATSCVASGSWSGPQALSSNGVGTGPMSAGTYSYGLTCTGDGGTTSAVRTLTVGQAPAPDVSLQLSPAVVQPGGSTTLTWGAVNAVTCSASGGSGADGWSGDRATTDTDGFLAGPYAATGSIAFVLDCTGPGGTSSDTRILTVTHSAPPAPPSVALAATPGAIQSGDSIVLSWSSSSSTACAASGGTGADGWNGSQPLSSAGVTVGPITGTGSYTYTLTCTGAGGSIGSSANVVVSSAPPGGSGLSVDISVSPSAMVAGSSAALSWNSSSATACTASGSWSGSKPVAAAGHSTGTLSSAGTYSYSLTCTDSGGGSVTDTATLTVNPPPASVLSFSATPSSIQTGQSTSLAWSSLDATSCTASGGTGSDGWSGSHGLSSSGTSIGPFASPGTYIYSLSCTGPGGTSAVQSTTVTVSAPPAPATVVSFNASPSSVTAGDSVTLSWSTSNATSCTASGGTGSDGWGGATTTSNAGTSIGPLSAAGTYTYTLVCSGPGGASSPASVTVSVGAVTPPATIDAFSGSPTSLVAGQSTTLSWSSSNATSCTASNGAGGDGWGGAVAASSGGTAVGPIATPGNYTYSLVCSGPGGASGLSSVNITVSAPPSPAAITLLSATPNTIQEGQTTSIAWSSVNATSCTASGGAGGDGWGGAVATSNAGLTVGPIPTAGTYTYSLVCTGPGGASPTSSVSVAVNAAPVGAPTITLLANDTNPAQIEPGESLELEWSTTNATSCTASGGTGSDGWPGARPTSSSGLNLGTLSTPGIYTYSLSCSGPGGSTSESVVVSVIATSAVDCSIGVPSTALVTPAASVNTSVTGVCLLGCGVSNASRVIDTDLDNFATMNVAIGVAATTSLRVTDGSTSYPAGRKAGFLVAEPGQVLSLGALGHVTLRTLLNGVQQESATAATLLELTALGSQSDPNAGFLGFVTTKPFNAVRIDMGSLVGVAAEMNVYGACVTLQ